MTAPILVTKLYIPPPRPNAVARPHLIERLNHGLQPNRKLALNAAPAGFGKTSLLSAWIAAGGRPVAWLSLDAADNDHTRFLNLAYSHQKHLQQAGSEQPPGGLPPS